MTPGQYLRRKRGVATQEQVGYVVNVPESTVAMWEADAAATTPDQLEGLRRFWKMSVDEWNADLRGLK